MNEETILRDTIYLVRHGSMAYGTNIPGSDIDEKGICICSNKEYYFGFKKFEQKDKGWSDGNDRVIYDLRKFVRLALECNPNILEILYVDDSDILKMDVLGKRLRDNREMFLSRKAARTFSGYAYNQLHRMQNHYRWIQNPPKEPSEKDFTSLIRVEADETWGKQYGGHRITIRSKRDCIDVVHVDEEHFKAANKKYNQYLSWKKNRNPARAKLEEKYSFDTKHGMHLIRILRMGLEIIKDGDVIVRRPDKDELLDIRNGKVSYENLLKEAEDLKSQIDAAVEKSPLPEEPDYSAAQNLCVQLITTCLK